jgi:hypothetical protein
MAMLVGAALFATPSSGAILSWAPLYGFLDELDRQCPDNPVLQEEPPALRALLLGFVATLPRQAQAEIDETRTASCSAADAMSAPCEISAVVGVLGRQGRLREALAFVCAPAGGRR